MKKAAVRLKYVEAKVKLKKQLEEEEAIEKARQDKIREANAEIETSKRRDAELALFRERARTQTLQGEAILAELISDAPMIPLVRSRRDSIHSREGKISDQSASSSRCPALSLAIPY
jgi:hypothetical protein